MKFMDRLAVQDALKEGAKIAEELRALGACRYACALQADFPAISDFVSELLGVSERIAINKARNLCEKALAGKRPSGKDALQIKAQLASVAQLLYAANEGGLAFSVEFSARFFDRYLP